jgi:choline dehydrogenase
MGTDELAVVDQQLRVRGLDCLRVVDASIVPRIPRGHTNLPTMIVAEKAADLIRRSTRTSRHATAGAESPLIATSA